jgi:hypothetical protein
MAERVLLFLKMTGIIWISVLSIPFFHPFVTTSELIWVGGFLQIVAFLLCFMVPNLLAKMSTFLWRNRGATARKIEKMVYDSEFRMEED